MFRANSWQWIGFEDTAGRVEIKDPARYRATFNTDASLAVAADCNSAAGFYQGEGGNLTIEIGPVTLLACPQARESRSGEFIDGLRSAVSYAFEAENLRIEVAGENSSATLIFAPTDAAVVSPEAEHPKSDTSKPEYVTGLEAAYGVPSQAGWGSAVFYEHLQGGDDLGQAALAKYKFFVGDRYGEDAWMGPWKPVYTRQAGVQRDIVAELRGITDRDARPSVPMILDNMEGADGERARAALAAAFDDSVVTELVVYNLGDGGAMSGLLVAGRRAETGESTFLVFLLD